MDLIDEIKALQHRLCELTQQLATELAADELPDRALGLLFGRLSAEPVALLLDSVDEVFPMARLAPLPASPSWVAGVLDLRGEMIPVVDALARVQAAPREPELTDFIVVCRVQTRRVGIILQQVTDVKIAARGELQPSPPDVPYAPYVLGLLKGAGPPVLLLSVAVLTTGCETAVDAP